MATGETLAVEPVPPTFGGIFKVAFVEPAARPGAWVVKLEHCDYSSMNGLTLVTQLADTFQVGDKWVLTKESNPTVPK